MKIREGDKPKGLAYPIDRVKRYLRVTGTDQDEVIATLISAAVGIIEHHTWIVLQSRTYTLYTDEWHTYNDLQKFPVTAVTSVKYYDTDNSQQTLSTSDYWNDLHGGKVTIDRFPNLYTDRDNAVEIAFTAGYATYHDIPDEYVGLLMLIVSDLYDNRHTVAPTNYSEIQSPAIQHAMMNYTRRTFT